MKKILLLLLMPFLGMSQNQFAFGFDGTTAAMLSAGWQSTNQSSPLGAATWQNADFEVPLTGPIFGSGDVNTIPVGQAGGDNSFALVNYTSTTGARTISNWLITPDITVQNGDIVTFYSRKGTDGTTDYPDRLELRMSSVATVLPSGASGVGSFTTLCLTINPALAGGFVYPKTWTQYSYTVSGLTGLVPVKFAFRYYVTNGGPSGANSDIIGIDTFSVDRTLSTDSFFKNNFSVYPNPVNDVVSISSLNNSEITQVSIIDVNGRVIKDVNSNVSEISVSDLNAGIYFLKINTLDGVGTSKFVKN